MSCSDEGLGSSRIKKHCDVFLAKNFTYSDKIPIETAQATNYDNYVRPISGISNGSPYHMNFVPQGNSFLQMSNMYTYARVKIQKTDGSDIRLEDKVAVCNGFGLALFNNVKVQINNVEISSASNQNNHYKSYLQYLCTYGDSNLETQLQNVIWHPDTPGYFNRFDHQSGPNKGFVNRWTDLHTQNYEFDIAVPLNIDLVRSEQHLAPNVTLTLILEQTSNQFLIHTATNVECEVVLTDLKIYYRRIFLESSIFKTINLSQQKYVIPKTELKTLIGSIGVSNITQNLYSNQLPKSLCIAMIKSTAFNGHYKQSPWNFEHFDLSKLNLKVNSRSIPAEPYTPNFEKGLVAREYQDLFLNLGLFKSNHTNAITKKAFMNGSTLFVFDFSPDLCNANHIHLSNSGTLDLEIEFTSALTESIHVLVYSTFDQVIELDQEIGFRPESILI